MGIGASPSVPTPMVYTLIPRAAAAAAAVAGIDRAAVVLAVGEQQDHLGLARRPPQPVHRRREPGADRGAILQDPDPELQDRLLQHRVVDRDRHLGERLARERDDPDAVGAPAPTNSIACCLATSMRLLGAKSSASMLLEMSIAMTIAMPSFFTSTCGRRPRARRRHDPGGERQHPTARAAAANHAALAHQAAPGAGR